MSTPVTVTPLSQQDVECGFVYIAETRLFWVTLISAMIIRVCIARAVRGDTPGQMDAGRLRVGGGRYKTMGTVEVVVGGISAALALGVGDCSAAGITAFSLFLTPALLFLVGASWIRSGKGYITMADRIDSGLPLFTSTSPVVVPGALVAPAAVADGQYAKM